MRHIFSSSLFQVLIPITIITALLLSCGDGQDPKALHEQQVEEWYQDRLERLMEDRGWLQLAGLYWLEDGTHTFGTDQTRDIVLPAGSILEKAGSISLDKSEVTIRPAEPGLFHINGEALTGSISFDMENPLELEHGRLALTFIERDGLIGLRLYDSESEFYTSFEGIERFPVNGSKRVEATLIPHQDETQTIPIINVLGQTVDNDSPGILEFELDGEPHSLWAISASEGERLFVIVADQTNGQTSFGGGRFMYVDNPGPNNTITLDFNTLYNPPCAFSPHTTCPLPPPENRLRTSIEAGEKRYR